MRLQIEHRERAQRPDVAHRRRQLEPPRVRVLRHQPQLHVQHGDAAIAQLEPQRQRLEQPRENERQRLEPFDRPIEVERRFEPLVFHVRHQGTHVAPARNRMPDKPRLAET